MEMRGWQESEREREREREQRERERERETKPQSNYKFLSRNENETKWVHGDKWQKIAVRSLFPHLYSILPTFYVQLFLQLFFTYTLQSLTIRT